MAGFTAKEERFTIFNSEKKLKIPFFQRKYVWKEENWDELFDNFFVKDEPSFLGSILVQRNVIGAGSGVLDVIDGQQRLTTISILIMAIYDSINSETKENARAEMLNALFSKATFHSEYTPKLEHSKFDKSDYEKVICFEKNKEDFVGKEKGILGCYNHFINRLSNISDAKKEKVLDDFLNGNYLIWVIITLDKEMDEQSIFDTLNNSGVSLTASDTIKNFVFKKVDELYDEKYPSDSVTSFAAMNKLYEDNWEQVFIKDDDTESYWNSEVITGRIKRTKLDLFLYCFGVIKGFFSQYDNNISDLTKVYKQYLANEIKTIENVNDFLADLKKTAVIFKNNFENDSKESLYSYSKDNVLQRLLHLLKVNDVTTFHPFILKVLYDHENDTDLINEKLHLLEKYLLINYLNEDTSKIKNYNKMCMTMINDDGKLEEEVEEVSNDIKFTLLNHISNNFATYFLFWVELFRRTDSDDESSLKYVYSLEHIMPKKWKENWFNDIGNGLKDINGTQLDVPQSIEYRENHVSMLGNMTLLKGKLNSSISNKNFATKIVKIKEYASLKITKNDIVDRYYTKDKDKKISSWNEKLIEERNKKLREEIINALLY